MGTVFALACAAVGSSDLLGCFLAGLCISSMPGLAKIWDKEMKFFVAWGTRLFFACTIGFTFPPLSVLFSVSALVQGLALTAAAIVGKCAVAPFAMAAVSSPVNDNDYEEECVLPCATFAAAMNGRGEFSFLIAADSLAQGLLSQELYAAVIWALFLSSIATPFAFRAMLDARKRDEERQREEKRPGCSQELRDMSEMQSKRGEEQEERAV